MDKSHPLSMALKLSAHERILLAQDLWDSVADDPDAWVLTDAQRHLLDERLTALESAQSRPRPWREALDEIRSAR